MKDQTCREVIGFLGDYLDGGLPAAERDEFRRHLSACEACTAYLDSYRETIRRAKAALVAGHPPDYPAIPEEMVQAILAARHKPPAPPDATRDARP
jgi:anti-sigma factor RsiW